MKLYRRDLLSGTIGRKTDGNCAGLTCYRTQVVLSRLYEIRFSLSERYYDFRLGIRTNGQLFHSNPEYVEYTPLAYRHLFAVLRRLEIGSDDVLLDYGCGKGRALVAAATLPFQEIIGVELSSELCKVARANLCVARRLKCRTIRVVCEDAGEFNVPDSVTIIYFFNPFTGSVLRRVLAKIRESLDRVPRIIRVIFFNRAEFAKETAHLPWVRTLDEYQLNYPRVGCGLYQLG